MPSPTVPSAALPAWLQAPQAPRAPWYHEPWPWLLMAGPVAVIIAGVVTTVVAFRTSDGVVVSDYYKQGLMINQTRAREETARRHQLVARGALHDGLVRMTLGGGLAPPTLNLRLVHPTRAGFDLGIVLRQVQPGVYEGALVLPAPELRPVQGWQVTLEQGDWRLAGQWRLPGALELNSAAE